jgi:hypothetical protein
MKWPTIAAVLLAPCFAGCIPFVPCPYLYPSVSCVPAVKIEEPSDEVHVFRVDIADDESCIEFAEPGTYRLTEMHVWPGGWTCPQGKVAVDGGFIWNCIALIFDKHTDHTVRVRLYRTGYELVEIKAWDLPRNIEWKPAADAEEQEKAVDAVLRPTGKGFDTHVFIDSDNWKKGGWNFAHLHPRLFTSKHREALLFAAGEYERVAGIYLNMDSDQTTAHTRCLDKAKRLRGMAAE